MSLLTALQVGAAPAILNQANQFLASQMIAVTPPTTANYGALSLGATPQAFDGTTSGFYVGSSSGTYIAVNAPSGYAGHHAHFQTAGVTNLVILQSGIVGIGTRNIAGNGPFGDTALLIFDGGTPFLTLGTQYGIDSEATFSSAAVTAGYSVFARVRTTAAAYVMTSGYGIYVGTPSRGAGSTITTTYGLYVDAQTQAVTNAYGLYVATPSGAATINYGAYFAGGAPAVYIAAGGMTILAGGETITAGGLKVTAGNIGVGTAVNTTIAIYVSGTNTAGAVTEYGVFSDSTFSSAATTQGIAVLGRVNTAAVAYTMTTATALYASNPSKGAGSAITTGRGVYVEAQTAGATNNYGIYVEAPSGGATANIGIYCAGALTVSGATTTLDASNINGPVVLTGTAAVAGSTSLLSVGGSLANSTQTIQRGIALGNLTISASATVDVDGMYIGITTPNSIFTTTDFVLLRLAGIVKGASHTITNAYGLIISAITQGVTVNMGIACMAPIAINSLTSTNNQFWTSSAGAGTTQMFIGNASITVVSDMRLKRDIRPTTINALAIFRSLQVVDHTWDDPSDAAPVNRNSRGLWTSIIAQQAIDYVPWLVNASARDCRTCRAGERCAEHPSFWNVDWSHEFGLVTKGFQEIDARLFAVEDRTTALERENKVLRRQVLELQSMAA